MAALSGQPQYAIWILMRQRHDRVALALTKLYGNHFSARCNIYISHLCYDVSFRLSVTEVHWRIIANLGFKFRSKFTAHYGCGDG